MVKKFPIAQAMGFCICRGSQTIQRNTLRNVLQGIVVYFVCLEKQAPWPFGQGAVIIYPLGLFVVF
jgi:hypothetical protein